MAIRDWSVRRLQLTWVVGLALEALLVLAPRWQTQRLERESRARWEATTARPGTRTLTPAERDSVFGVLADSFGIRLAARGDTLTSVTLSPERQADLAAVGQGFQGLAVLVLLFAVVVYLPFPLALLLVTVRWRRARPAKPLGPAAA